MIAPSRYVLLTLASQLTGYSVKAMREKIRTGAWIEGRVYKRAPDGHILLDIKGYESWVENQQQVACAKSAEKCK